ncbi:MAG: nitrite reductase small subunit NirD [Jatrophihabitantaceae bacterium]
MTPAPTLWSRVCDYDALVPDRPAAALLATGQLAIVRLADGAVHAVANLDPFSGANVLARGLIGTRGMRSVIIGPMYKQAFDLVTGECLDDPAVRIAVYPVRVVDGGVEVAA